MSDSLPGFMQGMPFWLVYVVLLGAATARGHTLYWLARTVTTQTLDHTAPTKGWAKRMHSFLQGGGAQRGVETLRRWGLPAVSLCQLTVGFQSMVLCGAGVLRITWWKFALALLPGSMAWALIYSTIGFAAWNALLAAAAGSTWGILAIIAIVAALVVLVALKRRAAARLSSGESTLNG